MKKNNKQNIKSGFEVSSAILALSVVMLFTGISVVDGAENKRQLNIAQFDSDGALLKPSNLDTWIHLGSNLGQGYNEDLFDPKSPGTFHIVEIEPTAYEYFKENGHYANGTMIGLSFFSASDKSNPRLNGFSQDKLVSFEIHLIDEQQYDEGRAFFNFGLSTKANHIADPSRCIKCHEEEGAFESTFTQFYPKMKNLLEDHNKNN